MIHSRAPNPLAVGFTPKRATVVLTNELIRCLEPKELEAVVAHELAHIANRDTAVMTFVSGPSLLGDGIRTESSGRGFVFFYLFYWPVYVLGRLLMWAISRYRESRRTVAQPSSPVRPSS